MYKNSQGETVSAEQMQTWADANGMSIGEYAALAGYTLSNETEIQETNEKFFGKTPSKGAVNLEIAEKALRDISLSEEDRNRLFKEAGETYTTSEPGFSTDPRMPAQPTFITKSFCRRRKKTSCRVLR